MKTFEPGDAVKINRPGRAIHGALGRYREDGQGAGFGWVSFTKSDYFKLPRLELYRKTSLHDAKLFPLSQIEKHDA